MPFDSDAGTFQVPGPAGASAYEAWRGLGNTGTVSDFLATLVGKPGPASTVPGPDGKPGAAGVGVIAQRTASVAIDAWTAVVSDGPSACRPADPTNPGHRGRVIGVTAYGAVAGTRCEVQNLGDLSGPSRQYPSGALLHVGLNGALVAAPPMNARWRQSVATVVTDGNVIVLLGEAVIAGYAPIDDADYQCLATDTQVGFRTLTASRVVSLPDVDTFPLGQDLVIADESGACSDTITITVQPGAGTGDTIAGASSIILSSPYQALRFRRGTANLWIRL
ncbi:UNVERIFIED_CONTAM: hypothetical protein Q9R58_27940 [Methylobacteriaceae bacterium AG10]|nr:hypothetical protein [Methylobacteriaceae bacterium AG10]